MRTVHLTHDYDAPARNVWEVAIDYECLAEATQGLVSFEGLPDGQVQAGQSFTVMVSLFGRLPQQPYHMEIVAFDEGRMTLTSSERGSGVKFWRHTLQVEATVTGSRLLDRIEIDAGWLTGLFALWAKFMYSRRHKPRLRILDRKRAALAVVDQQHE